MIGSKVQYSLTTENVYLKKIANSKIGLHILHKALNEIIGIEKFDDKKILILIEIDDKLLDDVTLKNAVILITCVSQDDDKIYPQIF